MVEREQRETLGRVVPGKSEGLIVAGVGWMPEIPENCIFDSLG